jgi:hypothetical protein
VRYYNCFFGSIVIFHVNVFLHIDKTKTIMSEYPKLMTKGDAYTPARFWEIVMAETPEQEKKLRGEGFIIKEEYSVTQVVNYFNANLLILRSKQSAGI